MPFPSVLLLLLLLLSSRTETRPSFLTNAETLASSYAPVDPNDGPANLDEGLRLFALGRYDEASGPLWRAVVLHSHGDNSLSYQVDEAFSPFLRCYQLQDKILDGLIFVAAESYLRGQDALGELYLGQAVGLGGEHAGAQELQRAIKSEDDDGPSEQKFRLLKEIRDRHDASNPANRLKDGPSEEIRTSITKDTKEESPEELYNLGATYFNAKQLPRASELFELSCQKSDHRLSVACTNAVYLRTNLCDWGRWGEGFEKDMDIVREVTEAETRLFRSLESNYSEEMKRSAGMGYNNKQDLIHWQRSTSVHPHMMLGYPLSNEHAALKRYTAESLASLDELRARADGDTGAVKPRPEDLPYSVDKMRRKFAKSHRTNGPTPIRVGFVACGFNSKAVLFLSHDMFRFFDPDEVEVHVFSTGAPDHPRFIRETMRGVDWRQRVIDTVDHFHDVREYQSDHVGLARFIHAKEIQVLIEWDGYARQGDRSAGLMALRPAPIQVLHQEFLMTSGAQYFDYIVTDEVVSPMRLEGLYTEKFLYLPNHFFSKGHAVQREVIPPSLEYSPKEKGSEFRLGEGSPQENACLSSNPLGTNANDRDVSFVYCNFNKFLKNNPDTTRSWIRILREVPDSILCLLENPPEGVPNLRKFVAEATAADGVDLNNRIHVLPWEKNPFDHQRRSHSLCNVMLDSHPYNGHTTAQDALYAGVPIVTRSDGDDMSSRVSTSANMLLGLEELNAPGGSEEYENIAVRLGTDENWFHSVRARLVETCLQKDPMHPYWDVPRYVRNFEKGLKIIWDRFLDGKEMDHVVVVEDLGSERKPRGTMEDELAAKEEKRRNMKGKLERTNEEL